MPTLQKYFYLNLVVRARCPYYNLHSCGKGILPVLRITHHEQNDETGNQERSCEVDSILDLP
ncbi:hypothetical protein NUACC26_049280 [Scytonema sp. NUACC26]